MAPVWTTSFDLGQVFEDDNLLIDLETQNDSDTFKLEFSSSSSILNEPLRNAGGKILQINGTNLYLHDSVQTSLRSRKGFLSENSNIGLFAGSSFVIDNVVNITTLETCNVELRVMIQGNAPSFPITGSLDIGSNGITQTVTLTSVSNILDLVTEINNQANPETNFDILVTEENGGLFIEKTTNLNGNNIIFNSNISIGNIGINDGNYTEITLQALVMQINEVYDTINNGNILASTVEVNSEFFLELQSTDISRAIRIDQKNTNFLIALDINQFSDISNPQNLVSYISNEQINTNVIAESNDDGNLILSGSIIHLLPGDSLSNDVLEILGLNQLGNSFSQSTSEWLSIDNSTGVLQGVTPNVNITSRYEFQIRAIDANTVQRLFVNSSQIQSYNLEFPFSESFSVTPIDNGIPGSTIPVNISNSGSLYELITSINEALFPHFEVMISNKDTNNNDLILVRLSDHSSSNSGFSISTSNIFPNGMFTISDASTNTNVFYEEFEIYNSKQFFLIIQPSDVDAQISWNPGNIGMFRGGDVSEIRINVNNFDKIRDRVSFSILGNKQFDFINGSDEWSISRDTEGSFINSQGFLSFSEENTFRFDFNNGIFNGLLIEPSIRNYAPASNNFLIQETTGIILTENAGASPENLTNAWQVTCNTVSPSLHQIDLSAGNVDNYLDYIVGNPVSVSFFINPNTLNSFRINIDTDGGNRVC